MRLISNSPLREEESRRKIIVSLIVIIVQAIGLLILIAVASEFLARGAEILEHKFG